MRTLLLLVVLLAFGAYSAYAMTQVGYLGIWQAGTASVGALQVLIDLVIACALASAWIYVDARERGLSPWPFLLVTLFAGSFGPLLYLLVRERRAERRAGLAHG